jgi:hypothetical protein
MVRPSSQPEPEYQGTVLLRITRGEMFGLLPRTTAERGYVVYQERRISKILWTGEGIEAQVSGPTATVNLSESEIRATLACQCSLCGECQSPCHHAAATLLQWIDIRPTMQRLGPGALWRSHSRHPFVAPSRTAEDRVDLSHLTGPDLRSALDLQLSLQKRGTAVAQLNGNLVEIQITLPSGDSRVVSFSATTLPSALPLLRSLPRVQLDGALADLELSEARLHPILAATWTADGILLEPGYRFPDGSVVNVEDLAGCIHGRWARVGNRLCLVLDPVTPLVSYHRRGRQLLKGRDALRFLNLDHPQLKQQPWYAPVGALASFRQPTLPKLASFEAEPSAHGKILVRPAFRVGDHELEWCDAVNLIASGFARVGGLVARAPDLHLFERAGFRLPPRRPEKGLIGDRLAFIRLVAETGRQVVTSDAELGHLASVLRDVAPPPAPDPPGLISQLRPYQRQGMDWLWCRYLTGIGSLLADDMGLGKTHQVMALLCLVFDRDPGARCLVVSPRGVLEHWDHLLHIYAPSLRVHRFHGPSRSLEGLPEERCVVLTTYDIIFRSTEDLGGLTWEIAVFDEAQRIKNPRTKAARAARKIPARHRIALSGTPLENRLLELWSTSFFPATSARSGSFAQPIATRRSTSCTDSASGCRS